PRVDDRQPSGRMRVAWSVARADGDAELVAQVADVPHALPELILAEARFDPGGYDTQRLRARIGSAGVSLDARRAPLTAPMHLRWCGPLWPARRGRAPSRWARGWRAGAGGRDGRETRCAARRPGRPRCPSRARQP